MKFRDAVKKLNEIAGPKLNYISYRLTTSSSGDETCECAVYIIDDKIYTAPTWEECFDLLLGKEHLTTSQEQEPE